MLTVVFFLWHDPKSQWRGEYTYSARHVNAAKRMVEANLSTPHRFVCATDNRQGIDSSIDIVPLNRYADHLFKHGARFQKLLAWHPRAADIFGGERLLVMDLDNLVLDSLDTLVDRPEDVVLWRNPTAATKNRTFYNTSMMLLNAGARPYVYNKFSLENAKELQRLRLSGTDQAWVSYVLGDIEADWDGRDGVRSYRLDYHRGEIQHHTPERVIAFHGQWWPMSNVVRLKHPHLYRAYKRYWDAT